MSHSSVNCDRTGFQGVNEAFYLDALTRKPDHNDVRAPQQARFLDEPTLRCVVQA